MPYATKCEPETWRSRSGLVKYLYVYLIALAIFLLLDAIWLGLVARSFYQTHLGPLLLTRPRFGVAGLFYAIYIVGLLYFALVPGLDAANLSLTLLRAALFGFFCYLTYDASNLATLKGYAESIAIADIIWGAVLSAVTGGATFLVVRALAIWPA